MNCRRKPKMNEGGKNGAPEIQCRPVEKQRINERQAQSIPFIMSTMIVGALSNKYFFFYFDVLRSVLRFIMCVLHSICVNNASFQTISTSHFFRLLLSHNREEFAVFVYFIFFEINNFCSFANCKQISIIVIMCLLIFSGKKLLQFFFIHVTAAVVVFVVFVVLFVTSHCASCIILKKWNERSESNGKRNWKETWKLLSSDSLALERDAKGENHMINLARFINN